jgi:hypothetical protein
MSSNCPELIMNTPLNPSHRTALLALNECAQESAAYIQKIERKLTNSPCTENVSGPNPSLAIAAAAQCAQALKALGAATLGALNKNDCDAGFDSLQLNDMQIAQLMKLNQQLWGVTRHLLNIGKDLRPVLDEKVASANDLMYDYEIQVQIDYVLPKDDPYYRDDDDNFLTRRKESLKLPCGLMQKDCSLQCLPKSLLVDSHCWLFHDLYDHSYGPESPMLSWEDCLRIGAIHVNVQVLQQYSFGVEKC